MKAMLQPVWLIKLISQLVLSKVNASIFFSDAQTNVCTVYDIGLSEKHSSYKPSVLVNVCHVYDVCAKISIAVNT